ncbi:MAG: hypothetical protein KAV87_03520 [Desulfobacteraceae bacterium]|nr:hypothetical protein [Desulfobacteraceae bacterium]
MKLCASESAEANTEAKPTAFILISFLKKRSTRQQCCLVEEDGCDDDGTISFQLAIGLLW